MQAPQQAIPTSKSPRTLQPSTPTHPQPGLALPVLSCTPPHHHPPSSTTAVARPIFVTCRPFPAPLSCFTILAAIVLAQQSRQCVRSSASTVREPFRFPLPSPDPDANASFLDRKPPFAPTIPPPVHARRFLFPCCCTDSCAPVGQAGCQIANSCWEVSFAFISSTRGAARSTCQQIAPKNPPPSHKTRPS